MNIESLKASLEASKPTMLEPVTLAIETVDTSKWDGFDMVGGGSFFDKPEAKALTWLSGAPMNLVLDCSFFSVISADKWTAINTLRKDLLFIKNLWPKVKVMAFLSKPSVLELRTPAKPDEMADTVTTVDLRGPIPAKRKWAAFCFLFAYEEVPQWSDRFSYKQISVKDWKRMGLPSAVREGEVGQEVPASDELFLSIPKEDLGLPENDAFDWEDIDVSDLEPQLASKELEIAPVPYNDQRLSTLTASGETKPAPVIAALHPEVQAAADKHGIDLSKPAGRELQEMRKYFGSGSGLYLATVDFQLARVQTTLLTEEAQKRIWKALGDQSKPKRKRAKKRAKVARKMARKPTKRSRRR